MGVGGKTGLCRGSAEGATESTEGWKEKTGKTLDRMYSLSRKQDSLHQWKLEKRNLEGNINYLLWKKHLCWAIKTNLIISKTDNEDLTGI